MKEREPYKIISKELGSSLETGAKLAHVGKVIADIENVPITRQQELGIATIGGAQRVYDSAFDAHDILKSKSNGKIILDMINGSAQHTDQLDPSLVKAITLAHDNLNPESFQAFKGLTEAQIKSISQREAIPLEESFLHEITEEKGAYTVLVLALQINPNLDTKKRHCYEQLGYLVQLVDDYYDKELDKKEGIITLASIWDNAKIINEIKSQNKKVREGFIRNYEPYKLQELFVYMDTLLASIGILN